MSQGGDAGQLVHNDPKHGPESFLAVIATALALMTEAMLGREGWFPYALFGLGVLGLGLAVQEGTRRRIGMGVLATLLGAVMFRYMYWLFLWGIPGSIISFFSHE